MSPAPLVADPPVLTLSPSAAAAVCSVVTQATASQATGLRIAAETGGCSGMIYRLGLVPGPEAGDQIIDLGAAKVFIDADSRSLLAGTHVDFVAADADTDAGFVFDNPNPSLGCSCGRGLDDPAC